MAQLDILVSLAGLNAVIGGLGSLRTALRSVSKDAAAPPVVRAAATELSTMVQGFQGASRALALMIAGLERAANTAIEFANIQILTGGTGRDAAFMAGMGLEPGRAAALRSRMATDPMARFAAQQVGVSPRQMISPQFGSQNFAAGMRQALEGLRQVRNAEERLRYARMLGLEDMLPLLAASDRAWKNLMESMGRVNQAADQQSQAAVDLQANWKALTNNVNAMLASSDAVRGLNEALQYLNSHFTTALVFFKTLADALADIWEILFVDMVQGFKDLQTTFDPKHVRDLYDQLNKATDAQNNAAQAQAKAAQAMERGLHGGGQRARDALTGGFLNPSMDGWSFRMGAFGY
jgi:hypothetical protein